MRFQLVDNFHGADFRRTGNGATGESSTQEIAGVKRRREFGGNGAHQMMHRRERLHHKQFRYSHAAGRCHAANVVAHQVDNHQVFCPIFRRVGQLQRLRSICLRIFQPWQRAFDRASLDLLLLKLDKTFRRQAQNRAVSQA